MKRNMDEAAPFITRDMFPLLQYLRFCSQKAIIQLEELVVFAFANDVMVMYVVDTKTNTKTNTKTKKNTKCFKDPMYVVFLKSNINKWRNCFQWGLW